MVALIPQLITVGIFIALLFGHAALTHYCFSSKHSNNRRAGVIATFTLGLGMIVFAFLFATFLFDAFSTTDVELFSFLSTIIPSYMESTRELTCAQLDVISPITTTMLMVTIAALYYTVQFTDTSLSAFTTYLTTIFISGIYFLYAQGPASIFAAYEFLLLPSSLMIDYFSKTVRAREATYFMVAWTQIGAISLFTILIYLDTINSIDTLIQGLLTFSEEEKHLIIALTFFGFGTKMPVWPFYWWLPEAHVEVTTSFSIVLSGLSIKFAFLGFVRFLGVFSAGYLYWIFALIAMFGFLDAAFKMEAESDIKKIVAYQTVAEMHVLVLYASLDYSAFVDFIYYMFPTHCWMSVLSFILVDIIAKRYHSRNLEHLYGIFSGSPIIVKVIYLSVFVFSSLPGTSIFSVELYVQIAGSTSLFNFIVFIFFQFALVVFAKNIWWILLGGDMLYNSQVQSFTLTRSEALFIYILLLQLLPTFATVESCF